MSELYDNRQKPNSNFRKLLQERLDKANPRRTLTAEEHKRLSKLEGIVDTLRRDKNVQNRQLQSWLDEDDYTQIEAEWEPQKNFREKLKNKLTELKRYEYKLKETIIMRNCSDTYHRKGKKYAAYKLDRKCESLCEDALKILQKIVTGDASLQSWFDRNLDFGHGSLIDASLGNLSRLVTSRSIEKLREDSRLVKNIDVKISVVERAIYSIGIDIAAPSKGDSLILQKLLKTDD